MILSLLLGSDPPRLPVRLLVRATALFGIGDGTTRTALSRMTAAGEVRALDGRYELSAPALLRRRDRQEASRAGRTREWDGAWLQALVVADRPRPAADRAALRVGLRGARLGELRDGVWLRPDNLAAPPELPDVAWSTTRVLDVGPTAIRSSSALAARLWALDDWADRARVLVERMAPVTDRLAAGDRAVLASGFVLNADVLRHLQADPLLPHALLPRDWPGSILREQFAEYDVAYRRVLTVWFSEQSAASGSAAAGV